jgi:hypothetical protein
MERSRAATLAKRTVEYSALPDDVKESGVTAFAHYPLTEGEFLVSKLWDQFMNRGWRQNAITPSVRSEEKDKALIEELQMLSKAPRISSDEARTFDQNDADAIMFTHRVRPSRGKWRIVPPDVGAST